MPLVGGRHLKPVVCIRLQSNGLVDGEPRPICVHLHVFPRSLLVLVLFLEVDRVALKRVASVGVGRQLCSALVCLDLPVRRRRRQPGHCHLQILGL